jgi:2-amino-4-hydroxy-6-hydroxymethyldihydropteridine diphosphokinase
MIAEETTSPPSHAFIGLGSNIEPRLAYLKKAVEAIRKIGTLTGISAVFETAPVGDIPQPDYLNAVLELETLLGPLELGKELKSIEQQLGRVERPRWHEREIDLDLLFYDELILESPDYTIPHPEAHRRAFVLIPMLEIAPGYEHPVFRKTIADLVKGVDPHDARKTELSIA